MLPASMLLDLKQWAYAWFVKVMYLACYTLIKRYLTTLNSPFFSKTDAKNQGHMTPRCVHKPNLGIPMSNNRGFMLMTRFSRSDGRGKDRQQDSLLHKFWHTYLK